jgi:hypothetical protein
MTERERMIEYRITQGFTVVAIIVVFVLTLKGIGL